MKFINSDPKKESNEVKIVNLTVKIDIYYIEKNNITVTVQIKKRKK